MSAASFLALALAAAAAPPSGPLPPSLSVVGIERCNPRTVEDATACLTSNLSSDDQSDLAREGGAKYRPAVLQMLTSTWHLADPDAPLPKDMARRGIYYPDNAASVLIAIMDTKIQGLRVDYKRISNDLKKTARPSVTVAAPAPASQTITPIAPGAEPAMDGAIDVPVAQCARPNAVAGEIVVTCRKLPDGRLVATRRIPNPPKAPK